MTTPSYYKVRVKMPFHLANVVFLPGRDYTVTPVIYNATLADGTSFVSKCASTQVVQ